MENSTSVVEPFITQNPGNHSRCGEYPVAIREAEAISNDDDSVKLSCDTLNKNTLRCLLLLIPIFIPVIVYLKDTDATRRIFLAALVFCLVISFAFMLIALLRSRRNLSIDEDEAMTMNGDANRESTQRDIVNVTHRLLPRNLSADGNCQGLRCEIVPFAIEPRRLASFRQETPSSNHYVPVHSTMTQIYSCSSSSLRKLPATLQVRSESLIRVSPSVSHFELSALRSSSRRNLDTCQIGDHCDDPPSYEEALNYPLSNTLRDSQYQTQNTSAFSMNEKPSSNV